MCIRDRSTTPLLGVGQAYAEEALVAVASNFVGIASVLEADFERATEHELTITSGSTGKLFAQIVHGAPYDVFLAADRQRPRRLVEQGYAVEGSQRTYANGRLTLMASLGDERATDASDAVTRLKQGDFDRLAIANPDLAPYGRAAQEVLRHLGIADEVSSRVVRGENIGQTYALVSTGNADLGFVARAQRPTQAHSVWSIPSSMHSPIRQDLVLLDRAKDNEAARAFVAFLEIPAARARISAAGYEVE